MAAERSLCLWVSDEQEGSLRMLCRLLCLSGHTVHPARTVAELRDLAVRGVCQVVIFEPAMEQGAGLRLMAEFKAAGLLAIALTSHDQPEWIDEVMKAGFDQCMLKPIHYEDLVSVLEGLAHRIDDACTGPR
jgi:DNA-binding NtrC family response regulator